MNEDTLIRRGNLQRLATERQWGPADFRDHAQYGSYSYWRDVLTDEQKHFGEKAARHIEEALSLPRGWLDRIDEQVPAFVPVVREPTPKYVPTRWPFSIALYEQCRKLDDEQLERVERLIRAHLGLPVIADEAAHA